MNRLNIFPVLGLIILLTFACSGESRTENRAEDSATQVALDQVVTLPPDALSPSVPPSATASSSPTAIPTQTLTPTYTITPTPAPTYTPSATPLPAACVPAEEIQMGLVTGVVDGDTIKVLIDGQEYSLVYIGIDTPETHHPEKGEEYFGREATEKNQELVLDQELTLVKDVSDMDRYGRLLRYVFVPDMQGTFVNYELLRGGYASAVSYPPDLSCEQIFIWAERMAKEEAIGLWAPTPTSTEVAGTGVTGTIVIVKIFFNGVKGDKEPDEFVELRNDGGSAVQLAGWTLKDQANHTYTFPEFLIEPGQTCRVYTDEDHEEFCGFSYGFNNSAVWNNGGDCAYLTDAQGNLVVEYCY